MSDYIPDYITDAGYEWVYCPYCDKAGEEERAKRILDFEKRYGGGAGGEK